MTEQLITEIQRKMLPYLNNEQLMHLRDAMAETLEGATITYDSGSIPADETDAVEAFITAKRIEGCSEKTLSYYRKTIEALIAGVGKAVRQITTDDLRRYLTSYQVQRRSSKVTIDNIRRILSSFFSWLEDEDFIVKSPVRRIHKVKTAKVVKDTYTDEALELMRDNCTTARDLAMIDLLASSGMRVGELVTLNREDINFNERECVVIGKGNKERLVYFDARTKIHLQNYLEGRSDENPALFVSLKAPFGRLMIGGVEAVCKVFENVNTGGVPLTVFELVTATYATRDFDLRKDWVQCRNTICGFGDTLRTDLFDGIDETTFLTTVCLYTSYLNKQSGKTNTISCKKKDVLGLPYESYIANRDAVLSGFKIAKEFLLRDQCVFRQRDLPYTTQLIPLATICAVLGKSKCNELW